jgi:hypothetical protein
MGDEVAGIAEFMQGDRAETGHNHGFRAGVRSQLMMAWNLLRP